MVSEAVETSRENGDDEDAWRKRREDTTCAMVVAKLCTEVERMVPWRRGASRGSSLTAAIASVRICNHMPSSELVMMIMVFASSGVAFMM